MVWTCELCGHTYTNTQVGDLVWYDAPRCNRVCVATPSGERCGGIVYRKAGAPDKERTLPRK